jgi:hypothetical protein
VRSPAPPAGTLTPRGEAKCHIHDLLPVLQCPLDGRLSSVDGPKLGAGAFLLAAPASTPQHWLLRCHLEHGHSSELSDLDKRMSRGVLLWPDPAASAAVRGIWDALAEAGPPSLVTLTHRLHRRHVSLIVAEALPGDETLEAVAPVPARQVPLQIESVGVFPQGVLFLGCVANAHFSTSKSAFKQWRSPWRWTHGLASAR